MPRISNPKLTISLSGTSVTINVSYDVLFTEFERFLASKGLEFKESIWVLGVDSASEPRTVAGFSTTQMGDILFLFPTQRIPVSAGTGLFNVSRNRSLTVSRNQLQEDPGTDSDEITCKVSISPVGIPVNCDAFTLHQILGG